MKYQGSCHCGRIAFEAEGDLEQVMECNCSICGKRGALHWFVPRQQLRLATPEASLATYPFGPGTIQHHFCPVADAPRSARARTIPGRRWRPSTCVAWMASRYRA